MEHRDQNEQHDQGDLAAQIRCERLAPPRHEAMMSAGRSGGRYAERPARSYVTGRWTRRLRITSVVITGGAVLVALARFPFLPDTIPAHFNTLGEPDSWAPRASVFIPVVVAIAMMAVFTWLSRHPRTYNYLREITEENAQRQYRAGEQMMVVTSLGISIIFAGILLAITTPVNAVIVALPAALLIIGAIVWGLTRSSRA